MISVLIADDEYLIRNLIKNSVDWEALGLEVTGEASDGEQALVQIKKQKPRIALVDINMPFVNGLELAKQIHEIQLQTVVILLTGYKEFEYAKLAVTYQVFDYLLKPIDTAELTEALQRARNLVLIEDGKRRDFIEMETQKYNSQKLYKNQFLRKLAFGRVSLSQHQMTSELKKQGILLKPEHICAIAIQGDEYDEMNQDSLYMVGVLNIVEEILKQFSEVHNVCGFLESDNCVLLMFNLSQEEDMSALIDRCQLSIDSIYKSLRISVSMGIGKVCNEYDKMHISVQSALSALEDRFYEGGGKSFVFGEIRVNNETTDFTFINFELLYSCISTSRFEEGAKFLKNTFEKLRLKRNPIEQVKLIAMGLVAVFYSSTSKFQIAFEQTESGKDPYFELINKSNTFDKVELLVISLYQKIINGMQKTKDISKIVLATMEYIDDNYCKNDISLNNIAAAIHAAPAYVSFLFKKELDVSVTEYITSCRMKKVVELMASGEAYNQSTISEQIGYADPYYFSKCFKKYYGISPSNFLSRCTVLSEDRFAAADQKL